MVSLNESNFATTKEQKNNNPKKHTFETEVTWKFLEILMQSSQSNDWRKELAWVLGQLFIFKCVLKKFGNVLFTLKVLNGLYENYFPRTSSSLQKSYSEQNAMTFLKSWEIKMCTLNISKTTMKHVTIAL